MVLALISWLVIGIILGVISNMIVDLRGDTPIIPIAAAAGGAVAFGLLHALISGRGVIAFDVWSLLFATLGAAAGAGGYHLIRSRSIDTGSQKMRSSNNY